MTCRTREYLCARERIRDLHDWRSFAGLNSLCDICLLCLRPLLCSCLSLSFIPLFLDLFSSLFFPHQWRCQTRALPLTAGYDWTNQKQKEKASEEEEESDLLNSEEKTSITSCQISRCCRLRISEAGPERDCLWMCVCWKLKNVS